jgi:hypothetical protein
MCPRRVDFTSRVSVAMLARLVDWIVLPSKEMPANSQMGFLFLALPGKGLGRLSKKGVSGWALSNAFTLATQQYDSQAASKDAPIAPGSLKVAPRAGLPLNAQIRNPAPPAGLEHR